MWLSSRCGRAAPAAALTHRCCACWLRLARERPLRAGRRARSLDKLGARGRCTRRVQLEAGVLWVSPCASSPPAGAERAPSCAVLRSSLLLQRRRGAAPRTRCVVEGRQPARPHPAACRLPARPSRGAPPTHRAWRIARL
eukprot:scaffold1834_cov331-Prasinococcus_capsulatus_cf.AAC.2